LEACFVVLLPDDPAEILSSAILIRCLKAQVEDAIVHAVIRDDLQWLIFWHPELDGLITWREKPLELLEPLRDFLPDYIIDLDGTKRTHRLKARLKVLDFHIRRKRSGNDWPADAFETCRLFDVEDDGNGYRFVPEPFEGSLLPEDYMQGYLVLSLDSPETVRPIPDDRLIEMAVMTEKPMVITGKAADRNLANRIAQASGCAAFPACGDFTPGQTAAIISRSVGVIALDHLWTTVAGSLGLPVMNPAAGDPSSVAIWARTLFPSGHGRKTH
jgi:ADP-heptose:LPS heptosyltransferase